MLKEHYFAEWDTMQRHPDHRPTKTAVAENRFMYSERTLRRNLQRYEILWPPAEDPRRRKQLYYADHIRAA